MLVMALSRVPRLPPPPSHTRPKSLGDAAAIHPRATPLLKGGGGGERWNSRSWSAACRLTGLYEGLWGSLESLQRAGEEEEESGAPALPTTPQTSLRLSWLSPRSLAPVSLSLPPSFFPYFQRFFLSVCQPLPGPLLPGDSTSCFIFSSLCVAAAIRPAGNVLLNVPIYLFKFSAMKIFLYRCPRIIKKKKKKRNRTGIRHI